MTEKAPPSSNILLGLKERTLVLLLCCLAAFPFFNNVDEPIHFDLVIKYSHGHVPRGLETLSADSAVYLSLYSSLAYLGTPAMFPNGNFPPAALDAAG